MSLTAHYTRHDKAWSEAIDLADLLVRALTKHGHSARARPTWVEVDRLVLQPRFVNWFQLEHGIRTTTTIEASHAAASEPLWRFPRFLAPSARSAASVIPDGIFEWQHSAGDTIADSIAKGFEAWVEFDLPVFLDAALAKPKRCSAVVFNVPAKGAGRTVKRRAILGPPSHLVTSSAVAPEEEHPFCPCCLFTNAWKALEPHVMNPGVFGVRLYAARDAEGAHCADCRINGVDYPAGVAPLVTYAESWPARGFEARKQFLLVQDVPA